MNRSDLQKLAEIRVQDSEVLLGACRWAGAYYLAGYAVECALNGKSVLVRNLTNNSEKSATLRISNGNPQTVYAGKCSVAVEQATVGNLKWTDAGGTTPPPTEQIRVWRAFLNEAAVALLCTNNESPEYGELWLELAYTE